MSQRGPTPRQPVRSAAERNALVEANTDVAQMAVAKLWHQRESVRRLGWEGAEQEALVILMRAAEIWREHMGACFRTYAYTCCMKALPGIARQDRLWVKRWNSLGHMPVFTGCEDWHAGRSLRDFQENHESRASRLDATRTRVRHLLNHMPASVERDWLERRLEGLTYYEAWIALGRPRRSAESIGAAALRMARELAQEVDFACIQQSNP
mgnify:CR=1 FL=1